jgi:phosphate transport system permease protein
MAVVTPLRPPETPPVRLRPRRFYRRDAVVLGGAVAASFALVWLIYTQLLPFSGAFGFILCWRWWRSAS